MMIRNAQIARACALIGRRRALIAAYDAAYDRWLASQGPHPSTEQLDDALYELEQEYDELTHQIADALTRTDAPEQERQNG